MGRVLSAAAVPATTAVRSDIVAIKAARPRI
jgi:hypothetical protein